MIVKGAIFALIGIIVGVVGTILFFRMDIDITGNKEMRNVITSTTMLYYGQLFVKI